MEMSPKAIAAVTFPVVRKGYDPEQVRSFLSQLSRGVEELQNRALQAEAKARPQPPRRPAAAPEASVDSITKTLPLAQRTADATVAEARDEAEGIRRQAAERAESILAEAKAHGAQMVDRGRAGGAADRRESPVRGWRPRWTRSRLGGPRCPPTSRALSAHIRRAAGAGGIDRRHPHPGAREP